MASASFPMTQHNKSREIAKNEKSSANKPNKERICDKVLRDEDEETDDEDLNMNSSSPVIDRINNNFI